MSLCYSNRFTGLGSVGLARRGETSTEVLVLVIVIFSPLSPFVILISEPSVNPTVSQKEKKEKNYTVSLPIPVKE
jgi:hypothetical protein